ncbi:MAG: anaerobic ribonucleoside-triphosphate reductase activating protein [Kiritimatiellales bacterium]|nr:anaerobic ribonucleoside-triphosphate reductase activating protein [Kiritimatiellales bacterium]
MSAMQKKDTSVYAYLEKPSMVDFPKRFAAVFFISGCGFHCGFCHNAQLMAKKQAGLSREKVEAACAKFKKDWVNGAVITGGEPTGASDLPEIISLFKNQYGFAVKLDTNGSNPKMLEKCIANVDYVAMDVKSGFSLYPEFVGFSDIAKLRESIRLIREQARDYEFRTTVIETIHTDEQMLEVAEIVKGSKRYAMQAFLPRDELPDEKYRTLPRTTAARLKELETLVAGCADEILLRGA